MSYPDDIITAADYVNKGDSQSESHVLISDGSYMTTTLNYHARGQEVLTDGAMLASSIRVTRGEVTYTEVFSLPVPAGNYFYHKDDAVNEISKLLFHSSQSGSITVTYTAKGSRVTATMLNNIQNDLRTVEQVIGSGLLGVAHGRVIDVASTVTVDLAPYNITDTRNSIIITTTESGAGVSVTHSATTGIVTLTPDSTPQTINYLILVK